ncbi:MAG: pilus assembly protein [Planctomycetes bacterium]|nr:pilus assembly protein [Planctomycetota bacterium]
MIAYPRTKRQALAATEFAFVLPFLALMILGGVDFGRIVHVDLTVISAARSAGEFGSTHPYTTATRERWEERVRQAAVNEMAGMTSFDPSSLTVVIITTGTGTDARVAVTVSYPFEMVTRWPGLPTSVTVQRVTVMPLSRP